MDRKNPQSCCAIIVAAGSGSRMGNMPTTKQFMYLGREPVIVRTVRQFENCELIDSIVVVARQDEIPLYDEIKSAYPKLKTVVSGGATRAESVRNGLSAVPDDTDFIAIHDGARCLITPEMITDVVKCAFETGASSAGCRAVDTVKIVTDGDIIKSTPDRKTLWNAQTPQVSRLADYLSALCSEKVNPDVATDDNYLLECVGIPVKMVDCGVTNIKITSPEDLFIGEAILKMRG